MLVPAADPGKAACSKRPAQFCGETGPPPKALGPGRKVLGFGRARCRFWIRSVLAPWPARNRPGDSEQLAGAKSRRQAWIALGRPALLFPLPPAGRVNLGQRKTWGPEVRRKTLTSASFSGPPTLVLTPGMVRLGKCCRPSTTNLEETQLLRWFSAVVIAALENTPCPLAPGTHDDDDCWANR